MRLEKSKRKTTLVPMTIHTAPKLLIVEDDLEDRAAMVRVLEGAGYKTIKADNGEKASTGF
jgi:CheY-like chemotaxis protein